MDLERRALLIGASAFLTTPAWAQSPPSETFVGPIADYERVSGGHIGVYAKNLASGAEFAWRADERFVMCSTFKASLAALVLSRVDRGRDRLETPISYDAIDVDGPGWYAPAAKDNLAKGAMTIAEMCKAAVELSDHTCANLLLAHVGGPPALTAFWRANGDVVSRLEDPEPLLNRTPPGGLRDTTTPA